MSTLFFGFLGTANGADEFRHQKIAGQNFALRALECGDLTPLFSLNSPRHFSTADESMWPRRIAFGKWSIDWKAMRGRIAFPKHFVPNVRQVHAPPLKQETRELPREFPIRKPTVGEAIRFPYR